MTPALARRAAGGLGPVLCDPPGASAEDVAWPRACRDIEIQSEAPLVTACAFEQASTAPVLNIRRISASIRLWKRMDARGLPESVVKSYCLRSPGPRWERQRPIPSRTSHPAPAKVPTMSFWNAPPSSRRRGLELRPGAAVRRRERIAVTVLAALWFAWSRPVVARRFGTS